MGFNSGFKGLKSGKNKGSITGLGMMTPVHFMTTSRSILRKTNVLDKRCRENHNKFYVQYSFPKIVSYI